MVITHLPLFSETQWNWDKWLKRSFYIFRSKRRQDTDLSPSGLIFLISFVKRNFEPVKAVDNDQVRDSLHIQPTKADQTT